MPRHRGGVAAAVTEELDVERVVRLAEKLLAIPSVTTDEGRIAQFVHRWLDGMQPAELVRTGNNVFVAMQPFDPARRTIMLLGHLDTVPRLDDNPVRRDGDRLYGLGASDMKAACAVIMTVLADSAHRDLHHNVVGVLYAAEESSYARNELPLVREAVPHWFDRVDLAICMEPTDGAIELGCLGTAHAEVTFTGRRAHSARPWQGDNAIHRAAGTLGRLATRAPVPKDVGGFRFVESMSATTVAFRGARNVVPDRCVLNVNYRFAPGLGEAEVRAAFADLVGGDGQVDVVDFCPAAVPCGDNPLLAALRDVCGAGVEVRAKQAWTDVGRLSEWGVDAVNWGPGARSQAHQTGEWVSLAKVADAVAVLHRLLEGPPTASLPTTLVVGC